MSQIKIGIIGCGAIGKALALACEKRFAKTCRVSYVCDLEAEKARQVARLLGNRPSILSQKELIRKSDLIIEAADMAIVPELLREVLRLDKYLLVMSVGGLVIDHRMPSLLRRSKGRLFVPSGAIAGIDALLAARQGKIRRVTLTTKKPFSSLKDAPFFKRYKSRPAGIDRETLIFEGNARQAIQSFPQNINVAAILSLAGIGPVRTRVRIFATPKTGVNFHEVLIEGDSGRIRTQVENLPSTQNPKTSTLAVFSAVALLEKIFSEIKIGT